jgi:predicted ATPase/DNA-binding SARP family transcriptional activator
VARLTFWLVGQVQILLDDQVVDLGYNKVRALLAFLALEPHLVHSRAELAALLWPESSETTARKNLRQALTTLRTAIQDEQAQPPFLLVSRESIQFNPAASIHSDAGELALLLEQCAAHPHPDLETCPVCLDRLAQAVALYRGDLLKNLSLPDSLAFEEWLLLARERLRLQMIEMLGRLVAGCERSGSSEAAMQFARRRLVLDPWNEDATRALMRVLARSGQRTAALVEFERCKRVLAEELGIEPSVETRALSESIRGEANQPGPPAKKTLPGAPRLPLPLTGLIGRDREVAALLDLLRRDGTRLVTLLGSPGIGKTRLSMHIAGALAPDFEENVFFISLAGVTTPALALQTAAQALGFSESGRLSPFDSLVQALKDKKALLILDTFEQVLDAAPALLQLLQACQKLKLLVTARAPLHLRGEQRFVLRPLALPDPFCPPELNPFQASPAVRLFVERVQAFRPEFSLTSKNAKTIAAICARLDGLPLAIELAAASIRLMSPQHLLERLSGPSGAALQLLKDKVRDDELHHQTLRQAFQWSFDLLESGPRALFARLGVFSGSCTLEAADVICNVGDIQPGSLEAMDALLDNCLVQQEEGSQGEYRFSMLITLREFALDRLAASGEQETLQQRHADYFLTFAKLAEPELTGLRQVEWLERVEKDLDNLRAALDWTLKASPEQALELAAALFPFWHVRSYLNEGRLYLEKALALDPHTGAAPTPLRARALAAAGLLAQRLGDYGPATALISESIQLCRAAGDLPGLAYALNNQAIVCMSIGENGPALPLAEESLALCQELAYPLGVARAQMILGQIALNEDRLADAWQYLETSLAFWRSQGDLKNRILCLINLGRVQMVWGSTSQALALFEESLALSRTLKDQHWELIALWNSAEIYLRQGKVEQAAPLLADCLEQAGRLGDRYFEAVTLNRLGVVCLRQADFGEAARLLNASRQLGAQIGSKWVIADALANLGHTALCLGDLPGAEKHLKESLALFLEQGERSALALNLERLVRVELARGQAGRAAVLFRAAAAWRVGSCEPLPPAYQAEHEQALAQLGPALAEAALLTLEQAVAFALA